MSGTGTSFLLVLGTAVSSLAVTDVTITTTPPTQVIATDNADIAGFMSQIRSLLNIGVSSEDLPDSVIRELVFLRKAELQVYDQTKKTEATYDTEVLTDTAMRDRFRIATMYRTAALLVPAIPDIIREQFLRESTQYVEMKAEEKINIFLNNAKDAIEVDLPVGTSTSNVGELGVRYDRYVAF